MPARLMINGGSLFGEMQEVPISDLTLIAALTLGDAATATACLLVQRGP